MAVNTFTYKDLKVWQKSSHISIRIIQNVNNCRLFGLRDQIIRSLLSIPANIAEGFGRKGSREFLNFLSYARGSCDETSSHLYIASNLNIISKEEYLILDKELFTVSKMINALSSSERKNPKKGN